MKSKIIIGVVILTIIVLASIFLLNEKGKTPTSSSDADIGSGSGSTSRSNQPNQPSTHEINIAGFSYSPSTITISKGSTVTWTNQDTAKHTVTSDSGSELDSSLFGRGESYSHVFNEAGVYEYHCKPHPYMKAKIIVE